MEIDRIEKEKELQTMDLNDEYRSLFRHNFEQGLLLECSIPIMLHYTLGTFNLDWEPVQNLLLAYAIILLSYTRVQTILPAKYIWPSLVFAISFQETQSLEPFKWQRVIHFVTFAVNMEFIPRTFKNQFTLSEAFIFSSVSTYYFYFFVDSVIRKDNLAYIQGCNISNIFAFFPWAVLNLFLVIGFVYYQLTQQPISKYTAFQILMVAIAVGLLIIYPYNNIVTIKSFIVEVFQGDMPLLGYMAILLVAFFLLIDMYKVQLPNYMQRKLFHLMALLLFMPGIIGSKYSRPRLMMLAFNCVSVFLILLEAARWAGYLPEKVTVWFKEFSDGRERLQDTLITTHIYLLMGCALPFTDTYILLSGGIFPTEWVQWSTAGVVFLGIGDTTAAVFGKMYGTSLWRSISKKTMQGSSFCVWSIAITYYLLNMVIEPDLNHLFLCVIFAAAPAAALEGFTLQYDNLSCAMFFFVAMVFFHANFM